MHAKRFGIVLIVASLPCLFGGCAAALIAGGAVAKIKTTVLMTPEEGLEAFRRAGEVVYSPPEG